jgi:hypothetical protein
MPRAKDPIEKALKRALQTCQNSKDKALYTRALAEHWSKLKGPEMASEPSEPKPHDPEVTEADHD